MSVEGTGFHGEGKSNDEDDEFYQWMLSKDGGNAKRPLVDKLVDSGIDSINMLESIGDDLNEVTQHMNLNPIQKIKLKAILNKLPNKHTVIDKEETEALTQMQQKLTSMQNAVHLVANTTQNIDEEVQKHTKTIKSTFKQFHELLTQRESELITKLNKIANEKKSKLEDASNALNQQVDEAQKKLKQCHKRLKKSIGLDGIEARKQEILTIARDIDHVKVLTKEDSMINNHRIQITLNGTLMTKAIESFGDVYGGVIPILVSLKDNKNCSVGLQWKLNGKTQSNDNNKLKIEWTETKTDDIDAFEAKWQYNKQYDVNDHDETINVTVENKAAIYVFRVQYFDGNTWSTNSNIKSVSVELTDAWDPNCKHNELSIRGNSIVNTTGTQRSGYLSRVVNEGIHVWRFKIDKYNSGSQMIGIWKTKHKVVIEHWLGDGGDKCYSFILDQGSKYGGAHTSKRTYAVKCQNGDIVEMTLNLIHLTLSYKINNKDYGKAFDVEKTSYKGAATLISKDTTFTLLSYECRAR